MKACLKRQSLVFAIILITCWGSLASVLTGEALIVRGNELYGQGRYKRAIRIYRKAFRKGGNPAICQFNIGNCSFQIGAYGRSIRAYQRAVDFAPGFVRPHLNLAGIYSFIGEKGLAVISYQKALELDPENAAAWRGLGDVYADVGNLSGALRCFEKSLEIAPNDEGTHIRAAEVYLSMDDFAHAEAMIESAIQKQEESGELLDYLGDLYFWREDYDKAASIFIRAAESKPSDARLQYRIADATVRAGNPLSAIQYLERALQIKPHYGEAHFLLGTIYLNQSWMDQSLDQFCKAAELHETEAKSGIRNIAYHYYNLGDVERFAGITKRLLSYYPNDLQAREELAEIARPGK